MNFRILFVGCLCLFCAVTGFAADKKADDNSKLSYTLGYSTGQKIIQGISQENIDINRADFAVGLSDAVKGSQSRFSPAQMQQILTDFQNKMLFESQKQAQLAVESNRDQLVKSKTSPVDGNPKGKVTVVEFFDYQCVHCRRLTPNLAELKKNDPQLRIVYKELPIFGKDSNFAARAALAAQKQGKYQAMHEALMTSKKPLTNEQVLALAKQAKLNIKQLQKDMDSPAIAQELQSNRQLAQALGVNATPALIFTSTEALKNANMQPENMDDLVSILIPGAAPIEILQDTIGKVQKKVNKKAGKLPQVQEQREAPGTWKGI